MVKIEIDEDMCKGCGLCTLFCPQNVFERSDTLNKKGVFPPVVVREDRCVKCRLCELICPDFAIAVIEEKEDDIGGARRNKKSIRSENAV
ncbi:MAG: ferredoxin family protein [Theionarchaea archaeon]|nr:ferredoxin family protein [Theionarchaea archaeon]